jgi:hypothetical protein
MKKITITMIAAFGLFTATQAQMKPEAGSMSLGFHVTGLANVSFGNWSSSGLNGLVSDPYGILPGNTTLDALVPQNMLFGRYYLSSDLALRVSLGINSMTMNDHEIDSLFTGITTFDSKTSAFSFGLGAGIEKHFATSASRLDPYAGAMLGFASLGSIQNEVQSDYTDPVDSLSTTSRTNVVYKGGSAFNFDLIGGFNYFFSDNIAIGAEVMWGFGMASVGGEQTFENETNAGGANSTVTDVKNFQTKSSGFRVGATSGVNFSIFW